MLIKKLFKDSYNFLKKTDNLTSSLAQLLQLNKSDFDIISNCYHRMKGSEEELEKPMIYFNDLNVGQTFPQFEFNISDEIVDKYLKTVEDNNEVFKTVDDKGKRVVPSIIVSLFSFGAYKNFIENPPGSLHAKQEYEFLEPFYVGDKLTVQGKIEDKYVKNGRNFVVVKTEAKKDNRIVLNSLMTLLWIK